MADEPLTSQTAITGQLSDRISGLSPAKRALLELRLKEKLRTGGTEQTISGLTRPESIPASFAQQRLWLLHQLEPSSSAYIMTTTLRLKGRLNIAALEKSLNEMIRRHEVLRTTFALVDGQLTQVIDAEAKLILPVLDLSLGSASHIEAETQRIIDEESRKPFDLEKGPLVRAMVLRISNVEHIFLCLIHHIVSDGWSMGIFQRELSGLYEPFCNGKPSPFQELPIQYADFSVWQRKWLQGEVLENQLSYWKHQLENAPPMLELPTDRPRPVIQTFRGDSEGLTIPNTLAHELRNLSRHNRVTLFMTLLAAFKILLQRYTGQDDIVVGSPIAGRNRAETEGLIGFFVNTLVLRTDLAGNPTFRDLLGRVRMTALSAYAHQDLPFEKLVEELQPERDLSRTPLFQVFFNMLGLDSTDFELHGLAIERLTRALPESKFDFTVYIREKDGNIHLRLVYNADLFDQERMKELMNQFQSLLSQIVKNPDQKINSLSLITPKTKAILPDPTRPLPSKWLGSVHSRFSEQAQRVPDRIALSSDNGVWTYRQLDSRSNQIANHLLAKGIRPGDVVALYGYRAPSLICGVLGTLKAGAVFLILDRSYPTARVIDYLRIARPKGWIAVQGAAPASDDLDNFISALSLNVRLEIPDSPSAKSDDPLIGVPDSSPGLACEPDDLAYIAFTSGTSRQPKAILGNHRPLSHFIQWHCETFGLNDADRLSMLSGLSHDPLLRDIFTPLWLGATLCIPDLDRMAASELADWISQKQISVAHLTPAMGELLTEQGDSAANLSLRFVFFGGDVLTHQHVSRIRRIAPAATCVNFYGATETPQAMGYFIVPSRQRLSTEGDEASFKQIVPLGEGISDVQLLVLNPYDQLAGVGEIGEIHIRTPYLARGYLADEAMTQESFIINPLNRMAEDKVYRTGDLGRYSPAGLVEFAGRRDQQVKIRGFRVEPAEIEALLEKHSDIRHAVVQPQDSDSGHKKLVAYVVSKQSTDVSSADLRSFLRKKLPEYMVPSAFIHLDKLPLTHNGKVDRRALPVPDVRVESQVAAVGPRDAIELQVAQIWAEILGLESVSVTDNFFDIGGHSLLAVRVFAKIEKLFGKKLPLALLFQAPTIEQLANLLRQKDWAPSWSSLVAIQPKGSKPPFFCVHAHRGNVLNFNEFARCLGTDQPFYGLQAQGLDGKQSAHTRIEEMASHYLSEIRTVQPTGPYFLGGYCFGGKVALEIAHQLREQGEQVALVAMIDAYAPGYLRRLPWIERAIKLRFFHHWDNIKRLHPAHKLSYVLEKIKVAERRTGTQIKKLIAKLYLKRGIPLPPVLQEAVPKRRVRPSYDPRIYPGKITVFSPTEGPKGCHHESHMGWGKFTAEGLEICEIPGSSAKLILQPSVNHLAEQLGTCIDKASSNHR